MLTNSSMIILYDKELLQKECRKIFERNSTDNINNDYNNENDGNKSNEINFIEKSEIVNREIFEVYALIGFKSHRKAVVKYLLKIKKRFYDDLLNEEYSYYSLTKDYNAFTQLLKCLPSGLVFFGIGIITDILPLKVLNSKSIFEKNKIIWEIKEFLTTYINCTTLKSIYCESSNVNNLEYLCKPDVLNRNKVIRVSLSNKLIIQRKFYLVDNLSKSDLITYILNSIENTINSSYFIYNGNFLVSSEMKNENSDSYDLKSFEMSIKLNCNQISDYYQREKQSIEENENKNENCSLSKFDAIKLNNIIEDLDMTIKELINEDSNENNNNESNRLKYSSHDLTSIHLNLITPLKYIDSENIIGKNTIDRKPYGIYLELNINKTFYFSEDILIKDLEIKIKQIILSHIFNDYMTKFIESEKFKNERDNISDNDNISLNNFIYIDDQIKEHNKNINMDVNAITHKSINLKDDLFIEINDNEKLNLIYSILHLKD